MNTALLDEPEVIAVEPAALLAGQGVANFPAHELERRTPVRLVDASQDVRAGLETGAPPVLLATRSGPLGRTALSP